jgi:hypothetical protein
MYESLIPSSKPYFLRYDKDQIHIYSVDLDFCYEPIPHITIKMRGRIIHHSTLMLRKSMCLNPSTIGNSCLKGT